MGSFGPDGMLDAHKGMIVVCQGKKRSGKSVLALTLFRSFVGDRVVIDVAGDDGPVGPGVVELTGTVEDLPREWPEHLRPREGVPMILRFKPDVGSPTYLEDMDAVVGLAYSHSSREAPAMLLVHEQGIVAKVQKVKPHMRTVLMSNRHHGLNAVFCMPRSVNTDPLTLAQADVVYTFELPSKADRERTATTIGWPLADFELAVHELGPNEFLRFDANEKKPPPPPPGVDEDVWAAQHPDWRLIHQEALPANVVRDVEQWAHNVPAVR